MNYYSLLRSYIEKSGLSLSDIARNLENFGYKVSKGYISQLQNGKTGNPATTELNRAIATVTGGNVEELLTAALIEKAPEEIKSKFERLNMLKKLKSEYDNVIIKELPIDYVVSNLVKIPLLKSITVGQPLNKPEMIAGYEYVQANVLKGMEAFALRIKGDSMIGDHLVEGDVVICVVQKEVTSNDLAVVSVDQEEASIKRVKCQDDICMLIPSNPKMQPSLINSDKVEVIGKVVEVRRMY